MKGFVIKSRHWDSSRVVCRSCVMRLALPPVLAEYREVFFFSDRTVWELYGRKVGRAYRDAPGYIMPAGEAHKTPETLLKLLSAMAEAQLHRGACLVGLGGGVVGDVGGLAAALYMRGIDFIHIPTTILAQVDAAIGGKTAVDFAGVKNLIGTFRMPKLVLADTAFFATLPPREVRCGLGEIIKHGALSSSLFDALWAHRNELTDAALLAEFVPENVAFKARIVRQDAMELGLRKCLNLGHTTAHAFELTDNKLSHGEYVLVGILYEAELALEQGGDEAYLRQLQELCLRVLGGMPQLPPVRDIVHKAQLDKKNPAKGEVTVTAPIRKGEYALLTYSTEEYEAALERIQARFAAQG